MKAGYLAAADLDLDRGSPVAAAWRAVAEACGVGMGELAQLVASGQGLGVADLASAEARAIKLIPEKVIRRFGVLPLREDDRRIAVATSDPMNLEADEEIRFASGRQPVFEIAPPDLLREAIETRYSPDTVLEAMLRTMGPSEPETVHVLEDLGPEEVADGDAASAPIVRLSNLILRSAVTQGASDIHIEPGRSLGEVRFRVDGVMHQHAQLPMSILTRVVSRIKVVGRMDIADRLRPQDGRARIRVDARTLDLRISTVPALGGEKAVIRILDPQGSRRLEDLGLAPRDLAAFRKLIAFNEGIVIVTGPTGSGKTTTLYAALRELANGEVNIMTVEDPIEYELGGITQMQVEPKRGVTFASALRAILRQDPDIILIGEIRDHETAKIALQASMTGHLVLASLHTNDAVGVVQRLLDLGLDRPSLAATLRGAVSQRLARRLCRDCAPGAVSTETVGCRQCRQSGYRGRIPLLEVLTMSPALQDLVIQGASSMSLQQAAAAGGMRPLRDVGLDFVRSGVTTLKEIEATLGVHTVSPDAAPSTGAAAEPSPAAVAQHILVVDDDPVQRRLARGLLEKKGFRVSEASDGVDALEELEAGRDFSLVLLDYEMPRLNGEQVLSHLRASLDTATLPVVVLTGNDDVGVEVRLMENGADDYIRKPIEPQRFFARLNAALRRAEA